MASKYIGVEVPRKEDYRSFAGRGYGGPGVGRPPGCRPAGGDRGSYCQACKLRQRAGWQLYLGGQEWATITFAEVRGDDVLITVADGRIFRADYMDAVRCRPPPPRPGEVSWRPSHRTGSR